MGLLVFQELKKCPLFQSIAERSIIAAFQPFSRRSDILLKMDSLRVFSTFKSGRSMSKARSRRSDDSGPSRSSQDSRTTMRIRSLDEKPSVSRSEILNKLEKAKGPVEETAVKGQRFGDGFMQEGPAANQKPVVGDIRSNDPRDSMTTEKLKSMLNSNVVNFNGKEREVLSKILGK